jgi:hypothetical protein
MVKLFGWEIRRKSDENEIESFAPKIEEDGATTVISAGGSYGTYVDLEGSARTEAELVAKYREISLQPEIEEAIDDIVNESMDTDDETIVSINLDKLKYSDKVKKRIREEFDIILDLLQFNMIAFNIFRRWYIDGRMYYHVIIDLEKPEEGIKELRYIDPRKIRKVREIARERKGEIVVQKTKNEYYVYSDRAFGTQAPATANSTDYGSVGGLKIAKDAILHVSSGLMDKNNVFVLSYLHKAIRPLNMLRALEDATVIYRLSRAPERRVFYIDVGSLPKAKAEQYLRDMMVKHKNRLVYDATTGEIRDDRKYMCYDLGTKIPLLDGRTLELKEIIKEYEEGKTNWVYSCDPVTGKFYPGPISWAGITKYNAEVVKVTFDNGKSVICTPDHKFPVWEKGFVEAQHLTPQDSIIPGYRREKEITKDGVKYEQIYRNDTQTWEFTHREVSNWKNEVGLHKFFTYDSKYIDHKKTVVHHKNFDRYNNNPDNLVMMNHKDHMDYHKKIQSIEYTQEMINAVQYCAHIDISTENTVDYINSNVNIELWRSLNSNKNPKNRDIYNLTFTNKDLRRIFKLLDIKSWRSHKKELRNIRYEENDRTARGMNKKWSEGHRKLLSDSAKNRIPVSKTWKIFTPDGDSLIIENLSSFCRERNLNRSNIKGIYGSKCHKAEVLRNHKIVSVERLEEKTVVGSMSIDAEETYHSHHTYLLDAGVYTKNTMLEDYWLPRREGNRGTEITTLPSGQNLGVMDDVEYFQKKLYKALNVPVSRLQSESGFQLGRSAEISRDEVKFSKFVGRLRRQFSHIFYKALEKQLILKRVIAENEWQQIQSEINFDFAIDNYFSELKYADILISRAETLARLDSYVGKYYSNTWIRKNILMQDEDDIVEMDKEIEEEKKKGEHQDPNATPPESFDREPPQPKQEPEKEAPEDEQQLDQSLFPSNKPIKRK